MSVCGAETEANELLNALLAGEDVTLPDIDFDGNIWDIPDSIMQNLQQAVDRLTNDDLTTGAIDGSGTFDALMRGFKAHLREEFDKGRITGAEYTKAYIALTEGAMSNAVQYLINRDQTYWSAVTAQLQAFTARAGFETAKMQLAMANFQALTAKSEYGLTKMKIASEEVAYCTGKYQLDNILPQQLVLVKEQVETQRSQTLDTRTDGIPITGSVGKQKDLYAQQIVSYQRDAEVKAGKMWTDAWITMKTIDEGLDPPDAFTNTRLDQVLQVIATANGFGSM